MSITKLATSFALLLLMTVSASAQNCGCESTSRIVPHLPATHCNKGCGFGCNQNCVPADQLWAGFASNTTCKGCVRRNQLRPNLPGFGGAPACNLTECQTIGKIGIPVPSVSLNWPRPLHLPMANCQSLRPHWNDAFNVFGCGKQKNVRCDIQNDCYGKLGESKSATFQPLPSAVHGVPANPAPATQPNVQPYGQPVGDIPPAPVVEPITEAIKAPSFDNAKRFEYGTQDWSR